MRDFIMTYLPGLIAGLLLGAVLALAAQSWTFLPLGLVLGAAVMPLVKKDDKRYQARKTRDDNFRD